jgi:hypothetical protein
MSHLYFFKKWGCTHVINFDTIVRYELKWSGILVFFFVCFFFVVVFYFFIFYLFIYFFFLATSLSFLHLSMVYIMVSLASLLSFSQWVTGFKINRKPFSKNIILKDMIGDMSEVHTLSACKGRWTLDKLRKKTHSLFYFFH